jgi:hypothetical protein
LIRCTLVVVEEIVVLMVNDNYLVTYTNTNAISKVKIVKSFKSALFNSFIRG